MHNDYLEIIYKSDQSVGHNPLRSRTPTVHIISHNNPA